MPGPDKTPHGPFLLDPRTWAILAPLAALCGMAILW